MTEEAWLFCEDPRKVFVCLRPVATDRQLRLFACAFWHWHAQQQAERTTGAIGLEMIQALDYAERWAENGAPPRDAGPVFSIEFRWHPLFARHASDAAEWTIRGSAACGRGWIGPRVQVQQVALLREVFGNPFRPVVIGRRCRSAAALGLARVVYEERALELVPVLADALEEAGAEARLLEHLRRGGPHVRGCWAVDLVLAKERNRGVGSRF
jgi:hypothetical protein